MDGFLPGTIPGEYRGRHRAEPGAEALRDFVREGGTLIAFNNASLFAIDQFHLPVANVLAGSERPTSSIAPARCSTWNCGTWRIRWQPACRATRS